MSPPPPKQGSATIESNAGFERALAQVGAGASARLVAAGVRMGASLAVAALGVRLLGITGMGILAFLLSFVAITTKVFTFGLGAATVREISSTRALGDRSEMEQRIRAALTIGVVGGGSGLLVVLVLSQWIDIPLDPVGRLLTAGGIGILLFGASLYSTAVSIMRGLGRVVVAEVVPTLDNIGRLGVIVALTVLALPDVRFVGVGYGAVGIVLLGVSAYILRKEFDHMPGLLRPDFSAAREFVRIAIPFATMGAAHFALARFDVFVLGLTAEKAAVGVYDPTLRLVSAAASLAVTLFLVQFIPQATRLLSSGDRPGFRNLYITVSKLGFIATIPALLVLAVGPKVALHVVFGNEFPARADIVWVLIAGYAVHVAFGLNGASLMATGDRRAMITAGLVTTAGMLVLAFALIPTIGILGAAIATAGTFVVMNVTIAVQLARVTGVVPFRRDFVITLLSALIPVGLGLLIRHLGVRFGAIGLSAVSLGLWSAWVGALWLGRVVGSEDVAPLVSWLRRKRIEPDGTPSTTDMLGGGDV